MELRDAVYRMTSSGPSTRDFKFRDQIRDSSASAPRNISEGWGRFYPSQNAFYVRIAHGSLEETKNHLLHAKQQKYFSPDDHRKAWRLVKRAIGATVSYLLYLESKAAQENAGTIADDTQSARDENRPPTPPEPENQNPEPRTENREP